MKKIFKLSTLICLTIISSIMSSCSKSSEDAPAKNVLSELPSSTGAVSTSAISAGLTKKKIIQGLATTGAIFSNLDATSFSGKSTAMCENVNIFSQMFKDASQPDTVKCYMSEMKRLGIMKIDPADGQFHYMKIKNMGSSEEEGRADEPRIKLRLVKNSSGNVASFEMFSCFRANDSGAPIQSEYFKQDFTDGATLVSKFIGSQGTASFASQVNVTGNYDFDTQAWISKQLVGTRTYSDTGDNAGSFVQTLTLDQYSDTAKLQGAAYFTYGSSKMTNSFYTVAQLIGSDSLSTLGIGDGSTRATMTYDQTNDGTDDWTFSGYKSFDGDSFLDLGTASNGDFYSDVEGQTLPTIPAGTETVSFESSEEWNCALPSGKSWSVIDFNDGPAGAASNIGNSCETLNSSFMPCDY